VRYLLLIVLLLTVVGLAGCGDGFPDEEMHFGIEDKARPYAVVIEPAEAAPGETVQVTLLARAPDPDELDITWKVALDYDLGLYEVDEVERNYRQLTAAPPVADADGFLSQTFSWVVPDSALLITSALPDVLTDSELALLVTELIGPGAGSPPTRQAIDAWLKDRTAAELAMMDPLMREATWALADRFACQIRFRATLRTSRVIDVTRNLTIRHTARLDGPNTNHNAVVNSLAVIAVQKTDATVNELRAGQIAQTRHAFIEQGVRVADYLQIPLQPSWTYYLVTGFAPEQYDSPFNPDLLVTEDADYRWYYYRQDAPTADHHFFVAEDGTEAEMFDLDQEARIMPPGIGATVRVVAAVRDYRTDWIQFHATPGGAVVEGTIEFVAP